jgi:hypothetical protein
VDHLGVADELECDEPESAVDVVLAHLVHIALDRSEHEVIDCFQVRQLTCDRVWLGKVERDAAGAAADLVRGRLSAGEVSSGVVWIRPSPDDARASNMDASLPACRL